MKPIDDVIREREKQRAKWGDAHDDQHADGSLVVQAACLAVSCAPGGEAPRFKVVVETSVFGDAHVYDPWDLIGKHTHRERLVVAAALLVAEIERLDRQNPKVYRRQK